MGELVPNITDAMIKAGCDALIDTCGYFETEVPREQIVRSILERVFSCIQGQGRDISANQDWMK